MTEDCRVSEQKYEVVGLSPDNEAGYQALHEYLQDGWEVVYSYQEPMPREYCPDAEEWYATWINHVLLRRPVGDGRASD
jgi:hypothetical protein